MGKYVRTKDGRIEETFDLNINDIKNVENLWCDFHLDNGVLHFVDYFPKEKQTLEILQRELKNVAFVKRKINSDYYDYDYEPIEKEEIVKQSDNLAELCDEFVIKVDNEYLHAKYYPVDRTFYIYNTEEEISLEECLRFNYVVKGAIWTDKGLIYVAKMNEKGELELL